MKKIITMMAVAAACSTSAFAQVSNFTGVSAAANMTMDSSSTKFKDGSIADHSIGANVQAAYGYALTSDVVLSVGAAYALTDAAAGDFIDNSNGAVTTKLKNQSSLYVEPGFLLNPTTLVYGKVSYESATLNLNGSGYTLNKDIKGTGFGVGVRTMLNKNMFLQVEAKQITFDKENPADTGPFQAKGTVGSIGIGYKF